MYISYINPSFFIVCRREEELITAKKNRFKILSRANTIYRKCECCDRVRDLYFKMCVYDAEHGKFLVGTIDLCKNCGVAAGISALSFHKTKINSKEKLPTQEHFGNTIGTLPNKGGTSSTYLTSGLNKYKTALKFKDTPYIMGNVSQFSKPEDKIASRITSTLSSNSTAPILLTRTYKLNKKYTKNYRHYVTVSGYKTKDKKVRLIDRS